MVQSTTNFLFDTPDEYIGNSALRDNPRLFVCCRHEIMEFILTGRQMMGRPAPGSIPDIPVIDPFISRCHGWFETTEDKTYYIAAKTTNGTIFRRRVLNEGEKVDLWDGDEIIIPTGEEGGIADILLVYASTGKRVSIWRDLRIASRDALTGLSGRNTFHTWYLQNFKWREIADTSLFILDIDHFKTINDTYGHNAGDNALKRAAAGMVEMVNNIGYVCRWGGDEFVGIMVGLPESVRVALNELRSSLHGSSANDQFGITCSAGVVNMRFSDDLEILVSLADQALYYAKENGRDRVVLYEELKD